MLFVEARFFVFFILVFGIYWALPRTSQKKIFLLVASATFYAAWNWRFLGLMAVHIIADFNISRGIEQSPSQQTRKRLVILSICLNLGILGFFKYYNFFILSLHGLLENLGLPASLSTLSIILPVGISFFTFESLSYTVDVYRGTRKAVPRMLDLALFISFFPHLVAGPIVRANDLLPQLERGPRPFAAINFRRCLILFLVGFVKKACISDNLAPVVDAYFATPGTFKVVAAWIAVTFYAIQIYCDFSGYTDMARALSEMLGFSLAENFRSPYLSASITDFWRRWHMSLSSWLRDYLYISLGGNRRGTLRTYRNILVTMVLGGLWHGASWTFVAWGALHGIALCGHRLLSPFLTRLLGPRTRGVLGLPLTFIFVCIAWIFFRAPDFENALMCLRAYALFSSAGSASFPTWYFAVALLLTVAHVVAHKIDLTTLGTRAPAHRFAIAYGACVALVFPFMPLIYHPFIYFQF